MQKPIRIVAIVATGSSTCHIEESLAKIEDNFDWKMTSFSLKCFCEESIRFVRKDITEALTENLFIRTNLRGGRFLSKMASMEGWQILFVKILPTSENTLHCGRHTPATHRTYLREELCMRFGKPFDVRFLDLDSWTTANNILSAYWNKYSLQKEVFAV